MANTLKPTKKTEPSPLWPSPGLGQSYSHPVGWVTMQEGLYPWTSHRDMNVFRFVPLSEKYVPCIQHEWCQYLNLSPVHCAQCPDTLDLHCLYEIEFCSVFDPAYACTLPWTDLLIGSDYIYPSSPSTSSTPPNPSTSSN